jgi:excisionase family DNA binding protein
MSTLELELKSIVKTTVIELLGDVPIKAPELITVEDAAKVCGCHTSVIYSLVQESPANRFPAVKFGERTIKIDKRRLYTWIESGGLFSDVGGLDK